MELSLLKTYIIYKGWTSNNLPDEYENMVMSLVIESMPKWEAGTYCGEQCCDFADILELQCLKVQWQKQMILNFANIMSTG